MMSRSALLGAAKPIPSSLLHGRKVTRLSKSYIQGPVCLMGGFQYQRRVERLLSRGAEVHDFGKRVIKEQCYGEDVVSLQQFLGEEGYFNSMDGVTGYFGSVTREALMNWQRDQGLPVTGDFNNNCRWAYLKQQETKAAEAALPVVSVPVSGSPPILKSHMFAVVPAWQIYTGVALLAITMLGAVSHPSKSAAPRVSQRSNNQSAIRAFSSVVSLAARTASMLISFMFRGIVTALKLTFGFLRISASTTATCVMFLLAAAFSTMKFSVGAAVAGIMVICGAIQQAYFATLFHLIKVHRLQPHVAQTAKRSAVQKSRPAPELPADDAAEVEAMAPSVNDLLAFEADGKEAPRLSDEEVQRRIASMKKDAPQYTSVKRPGPRPLSAPRNGDAVASSKYGNYYGGPQVREGIKELLDDRKGPVPASGPAKRMQALGYPIPQGRRERGSASAKAKAASEATEQSPLSPVAAALARRQFNPPAARRQLEGSVQSQPTFQDVPAEEISSPPRATASPAVASGKAAVSSHLLAGTELESELPLKPVKVQRPGMYHAKPEVSNGVSSSAAAPAGNSSTVAVARPVPVMKDRHLTVGELMKAAALDFKGEEASSDLRAASAPLHDAIEQENSSLQAGSVAPEVVVSQGPIPVHKPAKLANR